jgi:hypothetical protein
MDKHDRPYRCSRTQCAKLLGFTSSSGLLRHEREVHFNHGGPKEILRCPVDGCKRHVGKAFSRMDGLAKHLGAVHGIKKSSAEIRRDYSFQFDSPDRKESVREHDDDSPGPKLQEDLAPVDYAAEFEREQEQYKLRDLELVNERRLLSLRLEQDDLDTAERHNLQDEVMQLMLLEQQNKKRMLMARQEHDSMLPQSATTLPLPYSSDSANGQQRYESDWYLLEQRNRERLLKARQELDHDRMPSQSATPLPPPDQLSPAQRQNYEMELMLLEQQNKKRLLMARQEQDNTPRDLSWYGQPVMSKDANLSGAGDDWWHASKYAEPLMQPRTLYKSENVGQASFLENPSIFVFPGVSYPITGLDNADAGSIASEFARDTGVSPGIQAFLATQQIDSQSVPHPNAQTDRPFRCDECPQSFNRNHDLKRHKRIHAAVKPFPCDFCGKSFSRKEALKVRSNRFL